MLKALELRESYITSAHRLGPDFLGRCLHSSNTYRRAVGFFSSSVFQVCTSEWLEFFEAGGRMRLIASPFLSARDIRALASGVYDRPHERERFDIRRDAQLTSGGTGSGDALLRGLIARDYLEIRVARPLARSQQVMYHEKIGIFSDGDGQLVAFSGSANETKTAYVGNFERIEVFRDWVPGERKRVGSTEVHFESLWNNEVEGLEVLRLDRALKEKALIVSQREKPVQRNDNAKPKRATSLAYPEALFPASGIEPREHQRAAIRAWARAGGRGILEMATGSGKTITALTLASQLYDKQGPPFAILFIAPLLHLVDQWRSVARTFGLDPIRCAEGQGRWYQNLSSAVDSLNAGRRPVLSIVSTSATMQSSTFQTLIDGIEPPLLVIADEVHNYGAEKTFRALPTRTRLRLGLSATPDRAYDAAGNARIREYFGETVFTYSLKNALDDGILTPYRYYPHTVDLTEDEAERYIELSESIIRMSGGKDVEERSENEALKLLLIKRARVVAAAKSKLPRLRELLSQRRHDSHILVYCGDGSVEGPVNEALTRQIDAAIHMIGNDLGMRCARYTAETPASRRQELLELFARGELQVLVAIRCLDEGVDVPATRSAYLLASSTNPRQFVQRRGRVLRTYPGKRRAELYDFFVTLPPSKYTRDHPLFRIARNLVKTQLDRVSDFASLAENGPSARGILLPLREHYKLLAEG